MSRDVIRPEGIGTRPIFIEEYRFIFRVGPRRHAGDDLDPVDVGFRLIIIVEGQYDVMPRRRLEDRVSRRPDDHISVSGDRRVARGVYLPTRRQKSLPMIGWGMLTGPNFIRRGLNEKGAYT